jgi:predicted phosphodiesterase
MPTATAPIGIMADSHGRLDPLRRAVDLFIRYGCNRWIHLGDLCDVDHPETAQACLDMVAGPQARVLCGNNETSLRLNQGERLASGLRLRLAALPFTLQIGNAVLAHSLPFPARLGARCALGTMDRDRAREFVHRYPGSHLFRGHSHRPAHLRLRDGCGEDVPVVAGQTVRLDDRHPSILTCGALTDGWVLIWDRPSGSVRHLNLD